MIDRLRKNKAACNFGWLVADRGTRLLVGVIVGSWVARYLGKQDFGLLNYSIALVAIFAALTPLGMDALVVREIIRKPREGGRQIATAIGFRLVAGVVAAFLALVFVFGLRRNEPQAWLLVGMLSVGTLVQSLESGELWFQAHTQMRRLVVPRMFLFLVINVLKVTAVLNGAGVVWFSIITAIEQAMSGGVTWIILRRSLGSTNRLSFDASCGWKILRQCWPLALSALFVILYMKISQIILGNLMGDAALGVYSAAIRIPEAALFLPMVLASSILPSLLQSRADGAEAYLVARLRYFRINVLLALSICIPVSLGAPWIIRILLGPSYSEAGPVLAVYVWSLLFVFLGVARMQYLLNEMLTHLSLWFSVVGLVVNLVSCFLLIPRYGAMGAAIVTVISQFISAFLSSAFHPMTRGVGREQLLAMITPWRIRSSASVPEPNKLWLKFSRICGTRP